MVASPRPTPPISTVIAPIAPLLHMPLHGEAHRFSSPLNLPRDLNEAAQFDFFPPMFPSKPLLPLARFRETPDFSPFFLQTLVSSPLPWFSLLRLRARFFPGPRSASGVHLKKFQAFQDFGVVRRPPFPTSVPPTLITKPATLPSSPLSIVLFRR